MPQEQLPLFTKIPSTPQQPQHLVVQAPVAENTVLGTLQAYYLYLRSGQYAKSTPDDFTRDVKRFGLFVRNKPVAEVIIQDVQQWLAQLKTADGHPLTAKTISRKTTALNNYFSWLVYEGVIKENPVMTIRNHRVTSPLPDILFEDECASLLHCASDDPRLYVFILLLLETGMKMEEMFALKVQHLDTSNKYSPEVWIKHIGKKVWKDRKLRLPAETVPALKDYHAAYHIEDMLFPITPRWVQLQMKLLREKAEMRKPVTGQVLRDTCAVRWLKRGEDIDAVLAKLGLREETWEDAKEKYLKLAGKAL